MAQNSLFKNRKEAGRKMAEQLALQVFHDPVILALPGGGVVIAEEIARALHLTLDVLVVMKLGSLDHPEYGQGAMCEDFVPIFRKGNVYEEMSIPTELSSIFEQEKRNLLNKMTIYRRGRPLPRLADRDVILVDDGFATGLSSAVAARFIKLKGASRVILAVPVGPQKTTDLMKKYIDEVFCFYTASMFSAFEFWYQDFTRVEDEEVVRVLRHFHHQRGHEVGDRDHI